MLHPDALVSLVNKMLLVSLFELISFLTLRKYK